MENKQNKKPKFFLILRIIGFSTLAIGLTLLTLGIFLGTDKFGFIIAGAMLTGISIMLIFVSFIPEFEKIMIANRRYVQEESKDDLTIIADNFADVSSGAVKKTAKSIKEGLRDTKYCKYCGEEIDDDSVFCNKCGAKQ